MFNGHTMSLVTNLNIIGPEINNIDFLTVAAITTSDYPNYQNIYNASILMPPTELLMAWADNQPMVMQTEYPRYLLSQDPDNMIVALLAALTKKNIILYIPQDEFAIFGMLLLNHLYYQYGVSVNFGQTRFNIIPTSIPLIISKFYMMDLMNFEDYVETYSSICSTFPPFVINKMAQEVNPFNGRPASFEEYYEYFNQLNASLSQRKRIQMCEKVDKK